METYALFPPVIIPARRQARLLLFAVPPLVGLLAVLLGRDPGLPQVYGRLGVDLLPTAGWLSGNPALDLLFSLLTGHLEARTAVFGVATVQGLGFVLLFLLAHGSLVIGGACRKVAVCSAVAAVGLFGGAGQTLLGTTVADSLTGLGLLATLLLLLAGRRLLLAPSPRMAMLTALGCGLPAGLMAGFQPTLFPVALGLAGALLAIRTGWRRRLLLTAACTFGVLLGFALAYGPWLWFLVREFGSAAVPGLDTFVPPAGWWRRLLAPAVFADLAGPAGETSWRDLRLPLLALLLPVSVLLGVTPGRHRNKPLATPFATRLLLAAGALALFGWLLSPASARPPFGLELLTPLLLVLTLGLLPTSLPCRGWMAVSLLFLVASTAQPGHIDQRPLIGADQAMILVAGFSPDPPPRDLFPAKVALVRIQGAGISPEVDTPFSARIRQRIRTHHGSFHLLVPDGQLALGQEALAHYGLLVAAPTCRIVSDDPAAERLHLCAVQPTRYLATLP
jgi:hypothetical protein